MMKRIGDNGEPCGSPARNGTVLSSSPSQAIFMVRLVLKSPTMFTSFSRNLKCARIVRSCSCLTQLKATSMSLSNKVGRVAGAFYIDLLRSHSSAIVRLVMSASIDDRWERDPYWSLVMAPVARPASASLAASIFSRVLPRHERKEIGHRPFGFLVSVLPGLGIGTHFASFHYSGNTLYYRSCENRVGSSSGFALWTAMTMRYETPSLTGAESGLHDEIAFCVSAMVTRLNVLLMSFIGGVAIGLAWGEVDRHWRGRIPHVERHTSFGMYLNLVCQVASALLLVCLVPSLPCICWICLIPGM